MVTVGGITINLTFNKPCSEHADLAHRQTGDCKWFMTSNLDGSLHMMVTSDGKTRGG